MNYSMLTIKIKYRHYLRLMSQVLSGAFLLLATVIAWPGYADVYVISNTSGLTVADVKDIFLGEKGFVGSTKLEPIDNSSLQAEFLSKAMQMDAGKYNSAWAKKSFRDGVNPPAVKGSDIEVLQYIRSNPAAVGYVTSAPADVKVITKF